MTADRPEQRALGQQPRCGRGWRTPPRGQTITCGSLAKNLIGRAAARLTREGVSDTVDDQGWARLLSLHPAARNLQHRVAGHKQPRLEGLPKLNITVEHIIQAAQTAPRGSYGGPDSIVLDLLTRSLLINPAQGRWHQVQRGASREGNPCSSGQIQRGGASREGNRPELCLPGCPSSRHPAVGGGRGPRGRGAALVERHGIRLVQALAAGSDLLAAPLPQLVRSVSF
jgi:hypothetical protein